MHKWDCRLNKLGHSFSDYFQVPALNYNYEHGKSVANVDNYEMRKHNIISRVPYLLHYCVIKNSSTEIKKPIHSQTCGIEWKVCG